MLARRLFGGMFGIATFIALHLSLPEARPDTSIEWHEIAPVDNNAVLVNPQMGWMLYEYSNTITNYGSRLEPSDALADWPGISTVYLRLPWSYVEPTEGQFNWSIVDTPAQRWIDRDKQIALRFSCSESWLRYGTPEWVQRAGAKGYDFDDGKGVLEKGPLWEPDFTDTVFLEKLDHFLAAVAQRYDGDPRVAFIDVGSLGVWGEGHTHGSTRIKYSPEVTRRHIDLHLKHFKKTPLVANDDFDHQGDETLDYAAKMGLWLRDDSILVSCKKPYRGHRFAPAFWPRSPVIIETEHYGGIVQRNCWPRSMLVQAVEDYHASYMSIHWWPREFLQAEQDRIVGINKRLGYRIQLRRLRYPKRVQADTPFEVQSTWANAGVAPCYPGGFASLTLKDARGGIVAVSVDERFDVRSLTVGPPGTPPVKECLSTCAFPMNLKPGSYDVFVSLGARIGTPTLAMPQAGDDGHRRYKIGSIEVLGAGGPQSRPN